MEERDLKIKAELINLAKQKKTVGYQELCNKCKLPLEVKNDSDLKILSDSLTRISKSEHEEKRPLLSALVFDSNKGMPGNGFFTMAKELKKFKGSELDFFIDELKAVYSEWQKM